MRDRVAIVLMPNAIKCKFKELSGLDRSRYAECKMWLYILYILIIFLYL
jgi:hypothetical protein